MFTWASLVPATHHGSHAESHPLVLVHHIGQELGRRCHRDALLVAQLIDAALPGQQALPEAAVGGSSSHGAQQVGVDLDHLLHRLRGDVGARCGPGVHRHDHAVLELPQEHGVILKQQESQSSPRWEAFFYFIGFIEKMDDDGGPIQTDAVSTEDQNIWLLSKLWRKQPVGFGIYRQKKKNVFVKFVQRWVQF